MWEALYIFKRKTIGTYVVFWNVFQASILFLSSLQRHMVEILSFFVGKKRTTYVLSKSAKLLNSPIIVVKVRVTIANVTWNNLDYSNARMSLNSCESLSRIKGMLTENVYIFQAEIICRNFLYNIARICCRHKALPVNRFHCLANNVFMLTSVDKTNLLLKKLIKEICVTDKKSPNNV